MGEEGEKEKGGGVPPSIRVSIPYISTGARLVYFRGEGWREEGEEEEEEEGEKCGCTFQFHCFAGYSVRQPEQVASPLSRQSQKESSSSPLPYPPPPSPLPISWLKVSVPEVLRFPAQSFHGFFPVLPGGLIGSPFRIPQDSFMFDSTCSSFR